VSAIPPSQPDEGSLIGKFFLWVNGNLFNPVSAKSFG
jgi:hypothetical protein